MIAPCFGLLLAGELAQLSLLKEYANRRDVFHTAFFRHLETFTPHAAVDLLIGIPLGVASFRRERWQIPLFAVLNVIQTVPLIALGLLLAPAGIARHASPGVEPTRRIGGVGIALAVIALTMYSLLPVAKHAAGLVPQVPRPVERYRHGHEPRWDLAARRTAACTAGLSFPDCASRRCRPSVSRSSPR